MANSSSGESLLARVDRILAVFDQHCPEPTLAQIAEAAALPPSTAHRILREMTALGWLQPGRERGYRVATRLWELASRAALAEDLAALAIPHMSDVHAVLRQHVHLGVVEGFDVLFAERIAVRDSGVPLRSMVAGRLPLHLSATGLALLSQCSEAFVATYCREVRDEHFPEGLPYERLRVDLERFARNGYAMQRNLIDDGAGGVAVPVRVPAAHQPVALGTVLAVADMSPGAVPGIVQTLRVAAHGISRSLGVET